MKKVFLFLCVVLLAGNIMAFSPPSADDPVEDYNSGEVDEGFAPPSADDSVEDYDEGGVGEGFAPPSADDEVIDYNAEIEASKNISETQNDDKVVEKSDVSADRDSNPWKNFYIYVVLVVLALGILSYFIFKSDKKEENQY